MRNFLEKTGVREQELCLLLQAETVGSLYRGEV